MHSALSWINLPNRVTYSTSKAATWSLTNGLRLLLGWVYTSRSLTQE
ncbi:hypothetical protein [Pseudomonas sp. RGM2987]|nr:hypothetical protein [Pseudomonas sp. RGM2987]MCJ8207951.1 hypothetical protein [Pseudomonas sp. RGM2987]